MIQNYVFINYTFISKLKYKKIQILLIITELLVTFQRKSGRTKKAKPKTCFVLITTYFYFGISGIREIINTPLVSDSVNDVVMGPKEPHIYPNIKKCSFENFYFQNS